MTDVAKLMLIIIDANPTLPGIVGPEKRPEPANASSQIQCWRAFSRRWFAEAKRIGCFNPVESGKVSPTIGQVIEPVVAEHHPKVAFKAGSGIQ